MSKGKILIVEDDFIEAMDIQRSLESYDFEVPYIASTGDEALDKILEIQPDLVLMDIILRGNKDGIEVANKIKDLEIPVIFLTVHSEDSTMEKVKLTEPYGYFKKPFDITEMKYAIEFAIYKNRQDKSTKRLRSKIIKVFNESQQISHIGSWDWNIKTNSSWWSDETYKIFEVPKNYKPSFEADINFVYPDDYVKFEKQIKNSLETHEPLNSEIRVSTANKTVKYCKILGKVHLDDQGEPKRFTGTVMDITQKKTDEEKINRLYRLYATLSQVNQAVVRVKDNNELFNAICRVCVEYGKFEMAWIGLIDKKGFLKPITHYGHEDGYLKKIRINLMDEKPSTGKPSVLTFKRGEISCISDIKDELNRTWQDEALKRNYNSLVSIPIKLKGDVIGNLNIYASKPNFFTKEEAGLVNQMAMDISYAVDVIETKTERQKAENALRKSDERFRSLFFKNSAVMLLIDPENGEIVDANPTAADYYGYPLKKLKSMNINQINTLPQEEIEKALKKGKSGAQYFIFQHKLADGSLRSVEAFTSTIQLELRNIIFVIINDITERKEMEENLKHSNEWLGLVQKAAKSGFWDWDMGNDQLIWSDEFYTLFGIHKKTEATIETWIGLLHPEDRDQAIKDIEISIEKKIPLDQEYRVIRPDGSEIWIRALGSSFYGDDGKAQRMSGICLDITRNKKEEKHHRDVEIEYSSLFKHMLNGFAYCKIICENGLPVDFIYLDVNEAFEKLTGLYDVVGKRVTEIIPEITIYDKELINTYGRVSSTGIPEVFEIYVESLDDWYSLSVYSPHPQYFVAIFDVITERKKTEEELIKSESKFRELFDNAYDMISLNKMHEGGLPGNFIEVNKIGIERLGYTREEFLNMTPRDIVAPYNHSEIEKNAKKMKVNGYAQYELVHLAKDDREIPVEINNHLFKLEGETVALAISRDITERKKAENIIKNSLKEKEVLLKEIHHRVKNNMQIISSLLNLQSCSIDDKETLNVLQESQNRVRSMAIMHEKLYQSNDLTNLQFNDYIERLVSDLFFSYNVNKRINAVFDVDDVKLNMETAVPLGLIVSELVSNCLKHAFPNDMKGNILISLKKQEDRYILIIKDNGVGFPEDIDYKNTDSLGLQLVINLVGQIDGEIKLEKDDGTIFTIIFQEVKYKERI